MAYSFLRQHGSAVRAVGIEVVDAEYAYNRAIEKGAISVLKPRILRKTGEQNKTNIDTNDYHQGCATIAEVKMYGDVVMRFVSFGKNSETSSDGCRSFSFLPTYADVDDPTPLDYGISRLDHAVGNVPELLTAVNYIARFTGFHEFAEFTAEDVGTVDSGLNSMVLASNNEMVLLPINEPTFNTPRKSQIQTYLEYNNGPGLQHLALMSSDIYRTLTEMKKCSEMGGFEVSLVCFSEPVKLH